MLTPPLRFASLRVRQQPLSPSVTPSPSACRLVLAVALVHCTGARPSSTTPIASTIHPQRSRSIHPSPSASDDSRRSHVAHISAAAAAHAHRHGRGHAGCTERSSNSSRRSIRSRRWTPLRSSRLRPPRRLRAAFPGGLRRRRRLPRDPHPAVPTQHGPQGEARREGEQHGGGAAVGGRHGRRSVRRRGQAGTRQVGRRSLGVPGHGGQERARHGPQQAVARGRGAHRRGDQGGARHGGGQKDRHGHAHARRQTLKGGGVHQVHAQRTESENAHVHMCMQREGNSEAK